MTDAVKVALRIFTTSLHTHGDKSQPHCKLIETAHCTHHIHCNTARGTHSHCNTPHIHMLHTHTRAHSHCNTSTASHESTFICTTRILHHTRALHFAIPHTFTYCIHESTFTLHYTFTYYIHSHCSGIFTRDIQERKHVASTHIYNHNTTKRATRIPTNTQQYATIQLTNNNKQVVVKELK